MRTIQHHFRRSRSAEICFWAVVCLTRLFTLLLACCNASWGDVVVIANQLDTDVLVSIDSDLGFQANTVAKGDCRPFFTTGRVTLSVGLRNKQIAAVPDTHFPLLANAAFALRRGAADTISLQQIVLGNAAPVPMTVPPTPSTLQASATIAEVPVTIWSDDKQPLQPERWQTAYQSRFEAAAAIVERYSGVRFKLRDFGTWHPDRSVRDFRHSLTEFINSVDPGTSLAIGFTFQYAAQRSVEVPRIGGIRFPLDPHILLRESTLSMTEPERIEVLVHELAHYLGACHSPDRNSVMRPQLADGQARNRKFEIRIDPANCLAMAMMSEALREGMVSHIQDLPEPVRLRFQKIYAALALESPGDPLPPKYLSLFR